MPQNSDNTRLRIVRLIEPALCLSCRFAAISTVTVESGNKRRMLHCKRLDCDNWQSEDIDDKPVSVD